MNKKFDLLNDFQKKIVEKTDEELIIILIRSQEYQPEFIALVKNELRAVRNIQSYNDFLSSRSDEEIYDYCFQPTKKYPDKLIELANNELTKRNLTIEHKQPNVGQLLEQTDLIEENAPNISFDNSSYRPLTIEVEEDSIKQYSDFTENLLFREKLSKDEAINELIKNGIDAENAEIITSNLLYSRNQRATKDMLYGALWFTGGSIATAANLGYIFWGAILFGAIQFIYGLVNRR